MLNALLQRTKEFVRKKFEDPVSPVTNSSQISTPHTMNCTLTDDEIKDLTYDIIRTIKDPEKPETLEELNVVSEELISVDSDESCAYRNVTIGFTPTVPHCNLAGLIGLCIKVKLNRYFRGKHIKLIVYVTKGSHAKEAELNKQINDKERVAAAMENPDLKNIVENCIKEEE